MRVVRAWLGAWAVVAAVTGCGSDDAFSPTPATVQGEYNASRFTATNADQEFNLLSVGATVHVILNADGTTTGHLSVPDLGVGIGAVEADLAGTWSLSGTTVTFHPADPDSPIGDADFTAAQNSLDGEGEIEGTTLHITLSKTG